jgi:hypothetical protein
VDDTPRQLRDSFRGNREITRRAVGFAGLRLASNLIPPRVASLLAADPSPGLVNASQAFTRLPTNGYKRERGLFQTWPKLELRWQVNIEW